MNPYLLIDTALLGSLCNKPWIKKNRRPRWITPIYGRQAVTVSPVVIDVTRAVECRRVDAMMELANAAGWPAVSFIETDMFLQEIVSHLQQFISVCTEQGEELTLRFADCAVLPALAAVATPAQWSAIAAPFNSWKVHGRDGKLLRLPLPVDTACEKCPLQLSGQQIHDLKEAMAVDQLLVNLRRVRPELAFEDDSFKSYQLAERARRMWRAAGRTDGSDLVFFTCAVFDTDGRLFDAAALPAILSQDRIEMVRKEISRVSLMVKTKS